MRSKEEGNILTWQLYQGDALQTLKQLESESVHCCVTSPPYWGLRDYGVGGQLGLEPTPQEYIAKMVDVFREVKRVLRSDGTLWVNMGDSYMSNPNCDIGDPKNMVGRKRIDNPNRHRIQGLKPKDLVGTPWRLAFALQDDGWYLRADIIWSKPNPMPESVTDRPTKAHEYIFLLSKSSRYYYDAKTIREPLAESSISRLSQDIENQTGSARANGGRKTNGNMKAVRKSGNKERKINASDRLNTHMGSSIPWEGDTRNKRTVWTVATQPFSEAHFATFPPKLIVPCILAGCPEGGTVLDPFAGAGTTLYVAEQLERNSIGIEINPVYCDDIIRPRMDRLQPSIFQAQ